jgi:hypothetical protein
MKSHYEHAYDVLFRRSKFVAFNVIMLTLPQSITEQIIEFSICVLTPLINHTVRMRMYGDHFE